MPDLTLQHNQKPKEFACYCRLFFCLNCSRDVAGNREDTADARPSCQSNTGSRIADSEGLVHCRGPNKENRGSGSDLVRTNQLMLDFSLRSFLPSPPHWLTDSLPLTVFVVRAAEAAEGRVEASQQSYSSPPAHHQHHPRPHRHSHSSSPSPSLSLCSGLAVFLAVTTDHRGRHCQFL